MFLLTSVVYDLLYVSMFGGKNVLNCNYHERIYLLSLAIGVLCKPDFNQNILTVIIRNFLSRKLGKLSPFLFSKVKRKKQPQLTGNQVRILKLDDN